jgi:hypothetical protein
MWVPVAVPHPHPGEASLSTRLLSSSSYTGGGAFSIEVVNHSAGVKLYLSTWPPIKQSQPRLTRDMAV